VVITKDEETQQINEDVSIYSNYQLKDSVWTPLQISRDTTDAAPLKSFTTVVSSIPAFPTISSTNRPSPSRVPNPGQEEQELEIETAARRRTLLAAIRMVPDKITKNINNSA